MPISVSTIRKILAPLWLAWVILTCAKVSGIGLLWRPTGKSTESCPFMLYQPTEAISDPSALHSCLSSSTRPNWAIRMKQHSSVLMVLQISFQHECGTTGLPIFQAIQLFRSRYVRASLLGPLAVTMGTSKRIILPKFRGKMVQLNCLTIQLVTVEVPLYSCFFLLGIINRAKSP